MVKVTPVSSNPRLLESWQLPNCNIKKSRQSCWREKLWRMKDHMKREREATWRRTKVPSQQTD